MSLNNDGDDDSKLMPGPQGKTPRMYEVEKGHKSESYIVAIMGNKLPTAPPVKHVKEGIPAPAPRVLHDLEAPVSQTKDIPLHEMRPHPPTRDQPLRSAPAVPPPPKTTGARPLSTITDKDADNNESPAAAAAAPLQPMARPLSAIDKPGGRKDVDKDDDEDEEQPSKASAVPLPLSGNKLAPNADANVNEELLAADQKPAGDFGLSLAEVDKFRNDPFWRTLRWILFVLFWLLWILMFLAAILIVALSPACTVKVAPSWWQSAITYNLWTPSFQDSDGNGIGDINGAIDRMENIRRIGIKAILASPLLLSDGFNDAVRDHRAVDSKLGVNSDVDKFIETAHYKGMKVIMNLPVSITSNEHDWFIRSSKASLPENVNYSGYYHWRRTGSPPFMSEYKNTSVFYIHYKDHPNWPILNWQNNALREDMFNVFSYWIDKGIDGFQLSGIEYLARLSDGTLPNWPAIYDVLRDIKDHVQSYTNQSETLHDKQIILYANRDNAKENDKRLLASSGLDSVVNYELGMIGKDNKICYSNEDNIAGCVHEILSDILSFHSDNQQIIPMWEFGNPFISRLSSRVQSERQAELLTMLQLLLPGTNSIYYGEEIGMRDLFNDSTTVLAQRGAMQWDDTKNAGFSSADKPLIGVDSNYKEINWAKQYSESKSLLKMVQKLAKMRRRDDILAYGKAYISELVDNSAFAIIRYVAGNGNAQNGSTNQISMQHAIVGVLNFGSSAVVVKLDGIWVLNEFDMSKIQIVALTSNSIGYYIRQVIDLSDSHSITIPAEHGIVMKFTL